MHTPPRRRRSHRGVSRVSPSLVRFLVGHCQACSCSTDSTALPRGFVKTRLSANGQNAAAVVGVVGRRCPTDDAPARYVARGLRAANLEAGARGLSVVASVFNISAIPSNGLAFRRKECRNARIYWTSAESPSSYPSLYPSFQRQFSAPPLPLPSFSPSPFMCSIRAPLVRTGIGLDEPSCRASNSASWALTPTTSSRS